LGCLPSASLAAGASALHWGLVSQHQLKNSPGFCSFSWTLGTSGTLTATGFWSVPNTRFHLFSLLIASCRFIGLPICFEFTFFVDYLNKLVSIYFICFLQPWSTSTICSFAGFVTLVDFPFATSQYLDFALIWKFDFHQFFANFVLKLYREEA